jgi:hypothetical protein
MTNSTVFREAQAVAATTQATHINVCTGDPGATGANEATSARGAITWVAGASDGTVQGNLLTLASVPAGTYTHAALFAGSTGSNYLTSYLLPVPAVLTSAGAIKVTPQYVHPA